MITPIPVNGLCIPFFRADNFGNDGLRSNQERAATQALYEPKMTSSAMPLALPHRNELMVNRTMIRQSSFAGRIAEKASFRSAGTMITFRWHMPLQPIPLHLLWLPGFPCISFKATFTIVVSTISSRAQMMAVSVMITCGNRILPMMLTDP